MAALCLFADPNPFDDEELLEVRLVEKAAESDDRRDPVIGCEEDCD
jgi:hypothetical protein